jgi:hypothetical protein
MYSCNKESESNDNTDDNANYLLVGLQESGANVVQFNNLTINDAYWVNSKAGIVYLDSTNLLSIEKVFYVSKPTSTEKHYQRLSTLNSCEINTKDSSIVIHQKGDSVAKYDEFMTVKSMEFKTELGENNYIVIKFGDEIKYLGWIKINHINSYKLQIDSFCYYIK